MEGANVPVYVLEFLLGQYCSSDDPEVIDQGVENVKRMRKEKKMRKRDYSADYDENVDYDALEQHTYDDAPGHIFYTCPKCGNEYLATFITEENGEVMCIDCWNERYGDR